MMRQLWAATATALWSILTLVGCDSSEPGYLPTAQLESDLGVAVMRHLIAHLPDPSPGVPKAYAMVKGEISRGGHDAMSMDFVKRFADLKLRIISADVLTVSDPDNSVVDPETRLAPYVLQLRKVKQTSATSWEAEIGWSYKKLYERRRYGVTLKPDGSYEVTDEGLVEGNFEEAKPSTPASPPAGGAPPQPRS